MEETQENSVNLPNGWNPHLKYHFQLKTEMLGVVVWDFKGEEGNSQRDGKANVW